MMARQEQVNRHEFTVDKFVGKSARYKTTAINSSAALYVFLLISPGRLLIFLHGALCPAIVWTIFILINIYYFELLYRLLPLLRNKLKDLDGYFFRKIIQFAQSEQMGARWMT
jgi:hypothetical protein